MKKIKLSTGKYALVDDEDFELVSKYYWNGKRYATTLLPMHRLIMGVSKGQEIDHINADKMDNRKANLRIVTHGENLMNRPPLKNNTTGLKGVTWHQREQKYQVRVSKGRKREFLGYFEDKIEAAKIYNKRAKELYGDIAWLNPIP